MMRVGLLALVFVLMGAAARADDSGLMPPDGFLQAWTREGTPRVFTEADLYGHIDGGAEVFLELGFEQLTLQRFRNGGDEFTVEIYRMRDPVAATGIYLMKCGRETPDARLAARHTVSRYQLLLQRHRYYLTVNNVSGSERHVPALTRFAAYITEKLPADQPFTLPRLLPTSGLVAGSIRVIRGAFTLQALYTLGEGDMLSLGGTTTAVAGDYQPAGHEPYTLIVAEYPDASAARRAFLYVQNHLDRYLSIVGRTQTRLVLRDYANEFAMIELAGQRVDVKVRLKSQP